MERASVYISKNFTETFVFRLSFGVENEYFTNLHDGSKLPLKPHGQIPLLQFATVAVAHFFLNSSRNESTRKSSLVAIVMAPTNAACKVLSLGSSLSLCLGRLFFKEGCQKTTAIS
jgi:hypothetical protein